MNLLTDIVRNAAERYPARAALTMRMGYRTVSLTYAEAYALSRRVAGHLTRLGVGRGDPVLVLAPNSPSWICAFWGTLLRGAVIVPLNVQSTGEAISRIAAETGAKVMFLQGQRTDLPDGITAIHLQYLPEIVADAESPEPAEAAPDDMVQILYTSGTTGKPKGVVLTHGNLLSNVTALSELVPVRADDRFLSVLPLSHIFEQAAGFLMPYLNGIQIVYAHSPAAIQDLMREHRITVMAAVPEFLRVVMSRIETRARDGHLFWLLRVLRRLSLAIGSMTFGRLLFAPILRRMGGKLRLVASGGAPLDPGLEDKWNAMGVMLLQGYGLTETSPILTLNTPDHRRVGSVGRMLPGVQLRLGDDGEILAKGPGVFSGYFRNDQKTREAFTDDGWFRTGDIGRFDRDGFFFLKGRRTYVIIGPGGQNVHPEDIEEVLNRQPGVRDSCVLGVDRDDGGTEIHAVLLMEPDADGDPAGIVAAANRALASYQRINRWSVWTDADFPRSATRKVRKAEVRSWLMGRKPSPYGGAAADRAPLTRILAEVTGRAPADIAPGANLVRDLGLDSLLRIELVSRIEDALGVSVPESEITSDTTVSGLRESVARAGPLPRYFRFKQWPLSAWAVAVREAVRTFLALPFYRLFLRVRVTGQEHLRGLELPAVFMPNHISYLDPVVLLAALPPRIRGRLAFAAATDVLYEQYGRIAWLAELLMNAFPFPRKEGRNINEGLEYLGRLLDKGWSVAVYPEGRMSTDPGRSLQELKRGAGLIGVQMGVRIIPVRISDPDRVLPYDGLLPLGRGTVRVAFGRPLTLDPRTSYIDATRTIQDALARL